MIALTKRIYRKLIKFHLNQILRSRTDIKSDEFDSAVESLIFNILNRDPVGRVTTLEMVDLIEMSFREEKCKYFNGNITEEQ